MKKRILYLLLSGAVFFLALGCATQPKEYSDAFKHKTAAGKLLFLKGQVRDALEVFNQVLYQEPDFVPARMMRMKCYYYLKQTQEMGKDLTYLEKKQAGVAGLKYWKAKFWQQAGKKEEAETVFKEIVEEDPYSFQALYDLAQMLEAKKDFKESLRYYHQIQSLEPLIYHAKLSQVNLYHSLQFDAQAQNLLKEIQGPASLLNSDETLASRIRELTKKLQAGNGQS